MDGATHEHDAAEQAEAFGVARDGGVDRGERAERDERDLMGVGVNL